jgi:hypothetical protein
MEKSFSYYYGLAVLDGMSRVAPTSNRSLVSVPQVIEKTNKKLDLRDATVAMMRSPETTPSLAFQRRVDAYFGDCSASTLYHLVNKLYQVAHTHMLQRATDGPYDYHPNEFAVFLTQRVRYVTIDGEPPADASDDEDDENDPDWQP